jgi:hypothetical protein
MQQGSGSALRPYVSSGAVQGEIIEFWRAVEMFSPPAIPAASPSRRVFDVAADEPLPWDAGHPLQRLRLTKDQTWRHTIYVGHGGGIREKSK